MCNTVAQIALSVNQPLETLDCTASSHTSTFVATPGQGLQVIGMPVLWSLFPAATQLETEPVTDICVHLKVNIVHTFD